jgi:hypothetical protein
MKSFFKENITQKEKFIARLFAKKWYKNLQFQTFWSKFTMWIFYGLILVDKNRLINNMYLVFGFYDLNLVDNGVLFSAHIVKISFLFLRSVSIYLDLLNFRNCLYKILKFNFLQKSVSSYFKIVFFLPINW